MSTEPDQIRSDIEATRRELGSDVDALADKVNPAKVAQRQTDKVKDAVRSVKDRVMGVADDIHGDAGHMTDQAGAAVHTAVRKAQGNPFAVGLIAFGAGLLAASLIPASRAERDVAEAVKDAAQPLVDEVKGAAQSAAENLKEPAQDAVAAVKDSATEAVDHVKTEAASAADDVKGQAEHAKDAVQGQSDSGLSDASSDTWSDSEAPPRGF